MCKCVCFSPLYFRWLNTLFLTDSSAWVRYGTVRSPPSPYQYTGSLHMYVAPVDYGTLIRESIQGPQVPFTAVWVHMWCTSIIMALNFPAARMVMQSCFVV